MKVSMKPTRLLSTGQCVEEKSFNMQVTERGNYLARLLTQTAQRPPVYRMRYAE